LLTKITFVRSLLN